MLPSVNGIDILKEIKKNNIKAKVIMLTAKSELEDEDSTYSNIDLNGYKLYVGGNLLTK